MKKYDFSKISQNYKQKAIVQKTNSERLIKLLRIKSESDVLDLGCGPGHITKEIRELVNGKVIGIDPSIEMIKEAKKKYSSFNIDFQVKSAKDIKFNSEFDIIFISSAFQWFNPPHVPIENFYRALKKEGKVGIQAPATKNYCPMFINAINEVKNNDKTKDIFLHFKNPWFFLDTAEDYSKLFQKCGFKIILSEIIEFKMTKTPEEIYSIFSSGAIIGYLNQDFYKIKLTAKYINDFKEIIKNSFKDQCLKNGAGDLLFNRIFLIAQKG